MWSHKEFDFFEQKENGNYIVSEENINKILQYLGLLKSGNLITSCIFCEERFPFTCYTKMIYDDGDSARGLLIGQRFIPNSGWHEVYFKINDFRKLDCYEFPQNAICNFSLLYLDYYFLCKNEKSHTYTMRMLIFLCDGKVNIRKIGQFPENNFLNEKKSSYYSNILRRFDAYLDYKNAEKSNDYGLSAGAYDYLRRVFEKMIDFYLPKDFMEKTRVKDKIGEVKNNFHPEIKCFLKPLYEALSLGIHQLKDAECKEYYEDLKAVIDIQLQYIKEQDEMMKQIKDSSSALATLKEKYNK